MASESAAKRYAKALFDLASQEKSIDAVAADLTEIRSLLAQSEPLLRLVADPVIPADQAQHVLQALFAGRIHPLTQRFLDFLISKDRLALLPDICRIHDHLNDDAKGLAHATITTARKLSDEHLAAIQRRLADVTGKQIICHEIVDADLLAGFTIQIGDEVTDLSVRGQLLRLEQNIQHA